MTETFGGIVYNGIPLDGIHVRVADEHIELQSPSLFRTYRGSNAQLSAEGWYQTGDSGSFTNHVLQVFGRSDDMIITGGENVWPSAVEKVVSNIPGVERVVVNGVDDAQWGQRVVAWIVSSNPVAPTLDVVRQHVKLQLPSYCAPTEIRIVNDIPTTSLGKVDFHELKRMK
jgi:O-succinylbenzoic acid--CoA ligase